VLSGQKSVGMVILGAAISKSNENLINKQQLKLARSFSTICKNKTKNKFFNNKPFVYGYVHEQEGNKKIHKI
jgi:hypothetical protein